jgi:hypothetical protein
MMTNNKKVLDKAGKKNNLKQTQQQANNLATFLGAKKSKQSAKGDECSKQVLEFISFFCRSHKDEKAVYRTDEELFNEFYDWNMRLGRRVFGRQSFMVEFLELQKKLPKDSLSMTRELKIPVVYESLLGKRLRED